MNTLPFVTFGIVFIVVIWLWGRNLANPLIIAQAEAPEADVSSPRAGLIARIEVALYQEVQAGDVIAVISTMDPMILTNTLSLVRAEMDALRVDGGFSPGDKIRLAQFQYDWMNLRAELATLKAQLDYADAEFLRVSNLFASNLSSAGERDLALRNVERYRQSYADKKEVVQATEIMLKSLTPSSGGESGYVAAGLAVAEEKIRLAEAELKPIVLVAPINGRVRKVNKFTESTVAVGEPIVTISSPDVDRIVGFLSQPLRINPREGGRVTVVSRGLQRAVGDATILKVGPRVELFDSPLRTRGMGTSQQRGLPIIVSVPPNLKLLPGELVDLTLEVDSSMEAEPSTIKKS